MDGIIIMILIVVACAYFRRVDKAVYSVAIVDLFLRIFNYLISHVKIDGVTEYLTKYLPSSIPSIINKYTSNIVSDLLTWAYVIIMAIFLFYTFKVFFRKK